MFVDFEAKWVEFEQEYILELIQIERKARRFVMDVILLDNQLFHLDKSVGELSKLSKSRRKKIVTGGCNGGGSNRQMNHEGENRSSTKDCDNGGDVHNSHGTGAVSEDNHEDLQDSCAALGENSRSGDGSDCISSSGTECANIKDGEEDEELVDCSAERAALWGLRKICREKFVYKMFLLNSVSNYRRKGRDDLHVSILDTAEKIIQKICKGHSLICTYITNTSAVI